MARKLNAHIDSLCEGEYICIGVCFAKNDILSVLAHFTGFYFKRLHKLIIQDKHSEIILKHIEDRIIMQLSVEDIQYCYDISPVMLEYIVCCFYDMAYDTYSHPHADLSFPDIDVTISMLPNECCG